MIKSELIPSAETHIREFERAFSRVSIIDKNRLDCRVVIVDSNLCEVCVCVCVSIKSVRHHHSSVCVPT